MNILNLDNCPECGGSFNRKDVLQFFREVKEDPTNPNHAHYKDKTDEQIIEVAGMYGYTPEKPIYFSDLIGIEYEGFYDGVLVWECPHCQTQWGRFTGQKKPDLYTEIVSKFLNKGQTEFA